MPDIAIVQLPDGHHAVLHEVITRGAKKLLQRQQMMMMNQAPKIARSAKFAVDAENLNGSEDDPAAIATAFAMCDELAEIAWTGEDLDAIQAFETAAILAYLKSWTREEPIPTAGTIDDFPENVISPIAEAALLRAHAVLEGLDLTPDRALDPDSPTGPSGASSSALRDETSTGATPTLQSLNGSPSSDSGS